LPAYVEIMLTAEDVPAADEAATELARAAAQYRTPALHARAALARGAVRLGEDEPDQALPCLRKAYQLWHDLEAPYEAARVRVLIGRACRAMQDEDGAELEWAAARQVFQQLGAHPDIVKMNALSGARTTGVRSALSPREIEVLRLVAAGGTNRSIAAELTLSEKTVHRHLSNIFTKLGVGSRTAAAAYAFEHGISTTGSSSP
jgi:DNA-binding CsgD family transcriptional regulator